MKALTYTTAALKTLRKMPAKDSRAMLAKLKSYPAGEQQDIVKLQGADGYRLRLGHWRALMSVTETEITVGAIEHRRDVYRRN
jgi:mRNA interferase RelE/StbE